MNQFEEELQSNVEKGQLPAGDDLDTRAYREVFRALKKDPGYHLASDFAERVVAKLNQRQNRSWSSDYLWFLSGVFLVLMTSATALVLTDFRFDLGFLRAMSDYSGLAVFGIAFIIFLNWLDKRLVRSKLTHQSGH